MENEPENSPATVVEQLLTCEEVAGDKRYAQRLASVLEFTQLLFDDDENLTRVGNLSGAAKEKLQNRILEILDFAKPVEGEPGEPAEEASEQVAEEDE